jgi:hypothetical protein
MIGPLIYDSVHLFYVIFLGWWCNVSVWQASNVYESGNPARPQHYPESQRLTFNYLTLIPLQQNLSPSISATFTTSPVRSWVFDHRWYPRAPRFAQPHTTPSRLLIHHQPQFHFPSHPPITHNIAEFRQASTNICGLRGQAVIAWTCQFQNSKLTKPTDLH